MHVYGLIGNPLTHSFSKKYFTEKFEREHLDDCQFELYPLASIDEFPALIQSTINLRGIAVTIPYKEKVIPFLHELDDKASAIGAVNCIRISADKLVGYNTDSTGFERSLKPLLQSNHTKALVLGSGGSSKAVQYVLRQLGIVYLVVTRNGSPSDGSINYNSVNANTIRQYPLIINCTPVGMFPNEEQKLSLPYHILDSRNLLFDLVYRPAETLFMSLGKQYGAVVKNGYEMLEIQAEENWRIWNS